MTRDVALRIDGMLVGARGHLDSIAYYMKGNLPPEEFEELIKLIGGAMGEIFEFSSALHATFPDIVRKELTLGRKPDQ